MPLSSRVRNGLVFLACAVSMACAYYFELVMGLEPCPLCITQRVFVCLAGFIALAAAIHNPSTLGVRVYGGFVLVASVAGAYFSGRQLWLQSLPADEVPACGPPLEYIMQNFPMMEALQVLLRGDGNCSEVTWMFIGLSMPAWVLIIFVGLGLFAISNLLKPTS